MRGWPTVFVSGARVVHFHRSTTSRYYSERELTRIVETNYLRFLARSVASPEVFRGLWARALVRLNRLASADARSPALDALAASRHAAAWVEPAPPNAIDDRLILALGSGNIAVFPGRSRRGLRTVLVKAAFVPRPELDAFRQMQSDAAEFDQTLVAVTPELQSPTQELLEICSEIVLVRQSNRESPAFDAALEFTTRKCRPVRTRDFVTASPRS